MPQPQTSNSHQVANDDHRHYESEIVAFTLGAYKSSSTLDAVLVHLQSVTSLPANLTDNTSSPSSLYSIIHQWFIPSPSPLPHLCC